MGEHRQLFRFRLPWLSAGTTPRPATTPPRPAPAPQTQPPTQPSSTVPIQRPPFRPAGIAPVQTTPTQAQPKIEPQPEASPTRLTNQIRAASVPPSPSRRPTETQATSKTETTARAPTQARPASLPPSPSRAPAQARPTPARPPSPSRIPQKVSQPSPKKSLTATSTTSQRTAFQPSSVAVKPSEAATQVKEIEPVLLVGARDTFSATARPKEKDERKKVAEEHRKEARKGSTYEEAPEQRTITKHLAAATKAAGTKQKEFNKSKNVSSTNPKEHVPSNYDQALQKEIREDISTFVRKLASGQQKLPIDEKSISVLTLAGENRGAFFNLGSESTKKGGSVHIHRGYKINPDDSSETTTTDGEGSSKGRKPKDSITKENQAPRAYVNNNIQSINNSIVLESSVNERNPGVHLEFVHNLVESTKSTGAKAESVETCKAEFNITQADKLTYEPTVRRRCLRGLFAESDDSDPDNPEKPRRHGCRYSCGQKKKGKDMEVF